MRVAVFGGSFDPPHVAHVLLATYALSVGGFDRVLVVPVFAHAFSKSLSPFAQRLRMCQLAFAPLRAVQVSDIEATLPTPSFTLSTLQAIRRELPDASLNLVIGADALSETSKWHAFDEVARIAPPFAVGREGYDASGASHFALPRVSSTQVRKLLTSSDRSAQRAELSELLPRSVLEYIEQHGLYPPPP
ncbi:MAG TPA: nicotinate (nicotinamide) nucleotide adenylyltransferase [Polyangiaceae bacterium]|nr:nicotinate (nicotinamide) nucleotide adenylyltransferase [Polyangiaceae bacterium]